MIEGSTNQADTPEQDQITILVLALAMTALIAIGAGGLVFYLHLKNLTGAESRTYAVNSAELVALQTDTYLANGKQSAQLLSQEPALQKFLEQGGQQYRFEADQALDRYCKSLGGNVCYLMLSDGETKLSSNRNSETSFIGKNYAFRPYFKQAMKGLQAVYLATGITTKRRGIYFSSPVRLSSGEIGGVVVLKFPPQPIEHTFAPLNGIVGLVSESGLVFASNNPFWLYKTLWTLSSRDRELLLASRQFGNIDAGSLNLVQLENQIIKDPAGNRYLHHSTSLTHLPGWQIYYLQSAESLTSAVFSRYEYLGIVIIALFTLFAATIFILFRKVQKQIEQHNATRRALSDSENRFKLLVNVANEATLVVRGDEYIDCNPFAEQMLGYSRDEIIRLRVRDIVAAEFYPRSIKQVQAESEAVYETAVVTKNGHVIPVEAVGRNMDWHGEHVRVVSIRDLTLQKEQEKQILYHAHYDALTNLPNRALVRDRIDQAVKQAKSEQSKLAVLLIDLDDFKKVNDTLGHDIGDQVICDAAERLKSCIRENDTLARHGGDEFAVVLSNLGDTLEIEPIVKNILQTQSQPYCIGDLDLVITASIGLAVYPDDGENYTSLMQHADIAMYKAKADGKNTFHFYAPTMNRQAFRQLEIDRHLRQALEKEELSLVYQPLFNAKTGELEGAETLLRWNNSVLGQVSPAEFVSVAEQTGLIIQIGNWVIQEACQQARTWSDRCNKLFRISINVSPKQFQHEQFIDTLEQALQQTQLPTNCLQLEVTEGLLINENRQTDYTLRKLDKLGIRLSMDDFGTGYSSLSYLKNFPFQNLKIDRNFIHDITYNNDSQILVNATIAMAQGMGLSVTAEGIETGAQMEYLKKRGCDLLQGYLLGKPTTSDVFERKYLPRKLTA